MAYTLGCCFFGPGTLGIPPGPPPHAGHGTRRLHNAPATQFLGLSDWVPTSVHPAVWVGLAALCGVSILLYRRGCVAGGWGQPCRIR
jgi:hypothetical protein